MKKALFARGILGSLSLVGVIGAIGCSADVMDEGAAGEGEIDSVEQAIVKADVSATTNLPINVAFAASCIINSQADGSGVNYLVVAGGQTSDTPAYSANAYLLDGSTWRGPIALPTGMTNGTAKAAMMQRQNDKRECVLFGGEIASGGTMISQVAKLTFATDGGGNPTLTASQAGQLITARSRLEVVPCGDKSIAVLGGFNGLDSIEVWNGELNSGAGPTGTTSLATLKQNDESTTVTLNQGRHDFAAVSASNTHFAVAGGVSSGGARRSSVEAFTVQQDSDVGCKLADNIDADAHYTLTPTITARFGLKGFLSASAANDDTFTFVAGDKLVSGTPTAAQTESVVKIDWTTPANSSLVSQADNLAVATVSPALAKKPGGNAFVMGGGSVALNLAVSNYQENDAAPWTTVTQRTDNSALPVRIGATAQYNPTTDRVIVVGGHNLASPTKAFTNSVDLIVP